MARALSSSYSRFDTHIFLNVSSDARIEPLSQDKYGRRHSFEIRSRLTHSTDGDTLAVVWRNIDNDYHNIMQSGFHSQEDY